ncbi:hypothetical protein FA13DRAFT_1406236 [Coprinellus micaceus]|uniref:Uncharacterized protein n=1 Tax=Coprinellus micaceus TaxID=71717 RepID=A0A4Y7SPY3_COPMI|nr:hypothetical protein FA13DRAFT_1406236 [Coprinellus micaceus]
MRDIPSITCLASHHALRPKAGLVKTNTPEHVEAPENFGRLRYLRSEIKRPSVPVAIVAQVSPEYSVMNWTKKSVKLV